MEPIFEQIVCRWRPAHPRHDHQLIFPLSDDRLMFVWCEYYARRPSAVMRDTGTKAGQASDEMPCRISAMLSTDRCRSWSDPFVLQDNLWAHNVKHPNLVRLPSGEIVFFFVGWESPGQRNVFTKRSSDECETWSDIQQISEPGFYCNNHDHVVLLSSGRILLPAHGIVGGGPYRGGKSKLESFVYLSDDGFATWRRSANSMTAPGRGAHEPSIVELTDGRLLCILRTTQGRIYRAFSEDQGDHWSVAEATDLRAPDSESIVRRIPTSGDLLLLWNNVESHSNWPRTPLTAAISRDEGEIWECLRDIDNRPDRDAAYPAIFFQGDEVVVTYYTRPTAGPRDSEVMLRIYNVSQFYG